MSIESSLNFRRVGDAVTTSGTVVPDDLRTLGEVGIDVVIDLVPATSEYAVPGEADLVAAAGVEYIHIPVDFAAPSRADLDAFADAMDANEGRTVHVHCAANYRVSVFYGLYAQRKGWWDAARVEAHVRDVWNPAEFPVWADFMATEQARLAGG